MSMRTGSLRSLGLLLVVFIIGLAAVSSSSAVCGAAGKSCVLNTASNDRLCCPGFLCGYGNVCQRGCRINGTFYPNGTPRPGNPCQICAANASTSSWTPLSAGASCGSQSSTSCDRPDTCNASGACEVNLEPASTECRPSFGVCDPPENCTGSDPACPADVLQSGGVCRASGGECDVAESCAGDSANCPPDGKVAAGASCTADGSACTDDVCDGNSADCTHPPTPCTFCSVSAKVAVFDNSSYVDTTSASPNAESDNVQAALQAQGHVVTTYTATDAAGITAALVGQQVAVIPRMLNDIPQTTAVLNAYRAFLNGGGGIIVHGTLQTQDIGLLNRLLGTTLLTSDGQFNGPFNLVSASATGTAFCDGPSSLPGNYPSIMVHVANTTNFAAVGGTSIYDDVNHAHSVVSVFRYGSGKIIFIGWDFENAQPNGANDGGWLTVLDRAVNEITP